MPCNEGPARSFEIQKGQWILEHGALAIPHHSSLAVVLEASNVVGAIAQFLLPESSHILNL